MDRQADIARIVEQENELFYARFDEQEAFGLGVALRNEAVERDLPIVIDVRTWDRQLFFSAMAGSSDANADWVRRKINVVRRFLRASYRVVLEQDAEDGVFASRHGLDPRDYALAGGSFPIRLAGGNVIGCVTVSGLPQREDHNLVVRALCERLGVRSETLALDEA